MDIIGYTFRCHQTSWEISYKWRSINEWLSSMPRLMRPEGRNNLSLVGVWKTLQFIQVNNQNQHLKQWPLVCNHVTHQNCHKISENAVDPTFRHSQISYGWLCISTCLQQWSHDMPIKWWMLHPQKHIYPTPNYCPWKFLPCSAFLRRTKGLWLPRCYHFEWTKVMVRWTEFQPPLRNSKGSYGKGAPRSEAHRGVHRDVLRDMGNCEPNSQRLGLFHPETVWGLCASKNGPVGRETFNLVTHQGQCKKGCAGCWATVEAGTRGGNVALLPL